MSHRNYAALSNQSQDDVFNAALDKLNVLDLPSFAECEVAEKYLYADMMTKASGAEAWNFVNQFHPDTSTPDQVDQLAILFLNQPLHALEILTAEWPGDFLPSADRAAQELARLNQAVQYRYELARTLRQFHQRNILGRNTQLDLIFA